MHTLVSKPEDLPTVLQALDESDVIGLDTETTGLNPRLHSMRLLTLATGRGTWVIDCSVVDASRLFETLAGKRVAIHNASFDLGFLNKLGCRLGNVRDTLIMSQLVYAGTRVGHSLAACAERELGEVLDKSEQKSDWTGALSQQQLDYAAKDADILIPLERALDLKIRNLGATAVNEIESRCLPALNWLSNNGVAFDRIAWQSLAAEAEREAIHLTSALDAAAPPNPQGDLFGDSGWKWDSPAHVKQVFALIGCPIRNTNDNTLAALDAPLAGLLRQYRAAKKRSSTYGRDWLKYVDPDGRIYAGWRQLGADSGRMACHKPNLQNLPRDLRYRKCFVAPPGKVHLKADYSQIELRIAAKVSGDKALLEAYQQGGDLHTLTARNVLNKKEVSKEDRQLAKALNFGLLYGMGHRGFRVYARSHYNLDLTEEQAKQYRSAFFTAYPGLAQWHRQVRNAHALETRTLIGRRLTLTSEAPDTQRLNTPIQGTGADGLKNALALLWERRAECTGAIPILVVHDEIVIEVDNAKTEQATVWLKKAMLDGFGDWLNPVPIEVEVQTGLSWGG